MDLSFDFDKKSNFFTTEQIQDENNLFEQVPPFFDMEEGNFFERQQLQDDELSYGNHFISSFGFTGYERENVKPVFYITSKEKNSSLIFPYDQSQTNANKETFQSTFSECFSEHLSLEEIKKTKEKKKGRKKKEDRITISMHTKESIDIMLQKIKRCLHKLMNYYVNKILKEKFGFSLKKNFLRFEGKFNDILNITFNQLLFQKTLREIYQQYDKIASDRYSRTGESRNKKVLKALLESEDSEVKDFLNLTYREFYEDIFLKENRFTSEDSKYAKDPDYAKKLEKLSKDYISYFLTTNHPRKVKQGKNLGINYFKEIFD